MGHDVVVPYLSDTTSDNDKGVDLFLFRFVC